MSGSVNRVILIGHLGKDPEIRTLNGGSKVASFGLATTERWKDKATGEAKERTEWHQVVIFNENLVTVAEKYLKKGSKIYIEGAQHTRKYKAADGTERSVTETVLKQYKGEIALLDRSERPAPDEQSYGTTSTRQAPAPAGGTFAGDIDDEIPF